MNNSEKAWVYGTGRTQLGLFKKTTWVYRRTPRGRGKEANKNARVTGAAKTPRFEAE